MIAELPVDRSDRSAYDLIRQRMTRYPARSADTQMEVPAGTPGSWVTGRPPRQRSFVKAERRFYHHPNRVFRCPVGWLISRDIYESVAPAAWQVKAGAKRTWGQLIDTTQGESIYTPHVQEVVRSSWGRLPSLDMLHELQTLHDDYLPIFWQPQLDAIGAFRRYI